VHGKKQSTVSYPRTAEVFVNTTSHIDQHLVEGVCKDLVVDGDPVVLPIVAVSLAEEDGGYSLSPKPCSSPPEGM
jgi:hypothetical protein